MHPRRHERRLLASLDGGPSYGRRTRASAARKAPRPGGSSSSAQSPDRATSPQPPGANSRSPGGLGRAGVRVPPTGMPASASRGAGAERRAETPEDGERGITPPVWLVAQPDRAGQLPAVWHKVRVHTDTFREARGGRARIRLDGGHLAGWNTSRPRDCASLAVWLRSGKDSVSTGLRAALPRRVNAGRRPPNYAAPRPAFRAHTSRCRSRALGMPYTFQLASMIG